MALWHHKTLEMFAVQGSHSAVICYIAETVLLAEFMLGEAGKTSAFAKQAI